MKKETHGTRYAYTAGCRCKKCRKANSTYIAQYRRKRAQAGSQSACRHGLLWSHWEDVLASDYTKSSWQIAEMLGRTASAVTNRRRTLRTRQNKQG